jgi:hypothetical protein
MDPVSSEMEVVAYPGVPNSDPVQVIPSIHFFRLEPNILLLKIGIMERNWQILSRHN